VSAEARSRAGYGQYCPISRAVEVLGERWSLLIVRDMLCGTRRFNDLARGLPGLSRTLLSKRLRELERAGLVERLDGEYLLTPAGAELEPIVFGLGAWGAKWTFDDPTPDELDAQLLVWWMHKRIDASAFPDRRRIVLELRFRDDRRRFWVVIEDGDSSVCLTEPGWETDITIDSDLDSLYRVWLGQLPIREAVRSGRVGFDGPPALVRRMPDAMRLSQIAPAVAAATGRGPATAASLNTHPFTSP
jgi:DNA-binding HxlR family transcriptional regulator